MRVQRFYRDHLKEGERMMRRREREVMMAEREGVGKGFSESKKVEIGHSLHMNMKGRGIHQSRFTVNDM